MVQKPSCIKGADLSSLYWEFPLPTFLQQEPSPVLSNPRLLSSLLSKQYDSLPSHHLHPDYLLVTQTQTNVNICVCNFF